MSPNSQITRQDALNSSKVVDLQNYTGVWQTIATLRATGFQQGCRQKTQVEYQLKPDGLGLLVKNACEAFVLGDVVQEVSAVSKSENNRILLVRAYSGDTEGNYVIYDFSEEIVPAKNNLGDEEFSIQGYKWVLVGDGNLREVWLMARDPSQGTAIMRETQDLLKRLDIFDKLLLEPQIKAGYLINNSVEQTRNTTVQGYLSRV